MARPLTFVARYLRQQLDFAHFVTAALAAVGCSGIKTLIDAFASPPYGSTVIWIAFVLLVSLVAIDNLFWWLANWTANDVFVKVTGDLRSDLFQLRREAV